MKVLVTGADGFLGSNVVRLLLKENYKVNAFVQKGRDLSTLNGLDIAIFRGDLLDKKNIDRAIDGCDYLIHTAASTQLWPARSNTVRMVNINGTKNIMTAAVKARVGKIIYVGTANSFGSGTKADPADESYPRNSSKYKLDYMDSKYMAQLYILNEIKENNLPAVIVNPTMMIGSYDSASGFCAMIMAVLYKKSPGYSVGGRNYIYVKDVANGIVNALEKGKIGECYILGNQNLSYRQVFSEIASVTGVEPPKIKIPKGVVKTFGLFSSVKSAINNKPPVVSLPMARLACDDNYYSADKAVRELGLPQTPIRYAIKEAYQWLKDNNYFRGEAEC
ncbi:MAG: NAD-dependent epimerase/dehydratase family protein [Bacteroidetes bacterium]|nr:NAD-dependent epimerase/dehydratase family protein [Bacteroidota bacterium]